MADDPPPLSWPSRIFIALVCVFAAGFCWLAFTFLASSIIPECHRLLLYFRGVVPTGSAYERMRFPFLTAFVSLPFAFAFPAILYRKLVRLPPLKRLQVCGLITLFVLLGLKAPVPSQRMITMPT